MKVSNQQLESIKEYLETLYIVYDYTKVKKNIPKLTYRKYLLDLAQYGLQKCNEDEITFKSIMFDILENDNVLIPINILKQLANID